MRRRRFIQLVAGGLLAPSELFRGRSQVAVPGLWTPPTSVLDDIREAAEALRQQTGMRPNTLIVGRAAFAWLRDNGNELGVNVCYKGDITLGDLV